MPSRRGPPTVGEMYPFDEVTWQLGALRFALLLSGAFVVSWLATDIGRVRRTPYIAVLAVSTALLTWAVVGTASVWTHRVVPGLAGGVVAGALLAALARRIPASGRPHGGELGRLAVWEWLVYGTAEGVLLSVLPVVVVWQSASAIGLDATAPRALVALVAAAALVTVHHLGYWEFRSPLMRYPVVWCTVLAVAFIATGSPLAPIVGHVALHAAMTFRGMELPPHPRGVPLPSATSEDGSRRAGPRWGPRRGPVPPARSTGRRARPDRVAPPRRSPA